MESNLMKSVPTSLKLATVLESSWYLNHHGQLVENRPALTFVDDFYEGFLQRGNHPPAWSRHPASLLFSSHKMLDLRKSYLAFVLLNTVQENCLKKESRVNVIWFVISVRSSLCNHAGSKCLDPVTNFVWNPPNFLLYPPTKSHLTHYQNIFDSQTKSSCDRASIPTSLDVLVSFNTPGIWS